MTLDLTRVCTGQTFLLNDLRLLLHFWRLTLSYAHTSNCYWYGEGSNAQVTAKLLDWHLKCKNIWTGGEGRCSGQLVTLGGGSKHLEVSDCFWLARLRTYQPRTTSPWLSASFATIRVKGIKLQELSLLKQTAFCTESWQTHKEVRDYYYNEDIS